LQPDLQKQTFFSALHAATDANQNCTSNGLRTQAIFVFGGGVGSIWLMHSVGNFKKAPAGIGG